MGCLSDDQITAFVEGRVVDNALADRFDTHLDGCPTCRALVLAAMNHATEPGAEFPTEDSANRLGRYEIQTTLGAGAGGVVHAAWDPELNRRVAIKWLHSADGEVVEPEMLERFRREARAMARVDHPHVVKVFEVGESAGRPFIAMELVDGQTLRDWLGQATRNWRQIVDVFIQAGQGLEAAHSCGLVHRDFKPDNVLVDAIGRARVSDFGMVRRAGDIPRQAPMPAGALGGESRPTAVDERAEDLTLTGTVMGTPAYMAPEQHRAMPIGPSADQFAFCVGLFEALYDQRPYSGNDYAELRQAVMAGRPVRPAAMSRAPRALFRTVVRGLATDPRDRFPSMRELIAELKRVRGRGRTWQRTGLVALVSVGAVGAGVWFGSADDSTPAVTAVRAEVDAPASVLVNGQVDVQVDGSTDAVTAAPCVHLTQALDTVWNDGVGSRFVAGIASTWPKKPGPNTHEKFRAVWPRLGVVRGKLAKSLANGAFQLWSTARREACEATFVRQAQSSRLHDLRVLCLDRWRSEAHRFVQNGVSGRMSGSEATAALKGLKRKVSECDASKVAGLPTIPEATREAVSALQLKLDELGATAEVNRTDALRTQVRAATKEARRLGYRPTVAAALQLEAELIDALKPRGAALHKAYTEALAAKADTLAGDVALSLGFNALKQKDFTKASEWAELTAATYDRAERGQDFYVWIDSVRSFASHGLGRREDGTRFAVKALAGAKKFEFGPIDEALLTSNVARMQRAQGELTIAIETLGGAIRVAEVAGEEEIASKYRLLKERWKKVGP